MFDGLNLDQRIVSYICCLFYTQHTKPTTRNTGQGYEQPYLALSQDKGSGLLYAVAEGAPAWPTLVASIDPHTQTVAQVGACALCLAL